MDQGVGMILSELARLGLANNTLVAFLSDNGPPVLKNSKTTLYDAGGCVCDLIVRQPDSKPAVNPNMVSYLVH